jgi:hypothetical protein
MRALIPAVFLVAAGLICPTPSIPASTDLATVQLQTIQCRNGPLEIPKLFVAPAAEYPHLKYQLVRTAVDQIAIGYHECEVSLRQGNYFLKVTSDSCSNYVQASLLAGHERVLSMPLFRRVPTAPFECNVKLLSEENALAGTLPVRPQVAYLAPRRPLETVPGMATSECASPGVVKFVVGWLTRLPLPSGCARRVRARAVGSSCRISMRCE